MLRLLRDEDGIPLRRIGRAGLLERVEVRQTLEVEAARLAAVRHDTVDLDTMRTALVPAQSTT